MFFCIYRTKKYRYIMTARKSTQQNVVSGCGVRSEHRIDILNAKSIGKEHLNVFMTERVIEKTVSFWDPVEKFRRNHQKCFMKKLFLNIPQYSQENTYVGISFHLRWSPCNFDAGETPTEVFSYEYCRYFKSNFYTEHLRATDSRS